MTHRSIRRCCQTKHWHQEKPATSPPSWDVGRDKSECLNRLIEYKHQHTIHNISPPSMLKLRGFQQGLYGYVDVLSINESSMQPQLLPGTLTLLVYQDEEVSKECLPWNVLSNSVLSCARGIASEDLDRPNAWRHHESETNLQREDVLQATHWMHSITAHSRGIVWKMIESRSRGWLCCFCKQRLSNFVRSERPFPRCKRLSLPKRLTQLCPRRRQRVICLTPNNWQRNASRHNLPPIEHLFFWMTSIMYWRELLIKLRRPRTWYFTVRVGVCRRA